MSESTAVSTGADRRTIGAILRSHGYVTDAQLQDAAGVQSRTGKPLGQVLVEAGVITRLELASALAEQWSESSDWMHSPGETNAPGASREASAGIGLTVQRHEPDTGVLAARLTAVENALQEVLRSEPGVEPLEHAIADLARRLTSFEPTLAELERRTETAVDVDALESHLAVLAAATENASRRVDGTVDELSRIGADLAALQAAVVARPAPATASDLAALRDELTRLAERPARDPHLDETIAGLSSRLDELAARPAADPALADRLDRLATELAATASHERVAELQASVTELASRPRESIELNERLDELSRRVDALVVEAGSRVSGEVPEELRRAVEELASRPPLDEALAARVDEVARQLHERPSQEELARLRESLTAVSTRLDEQSRSLLTRLEGLAADDDVRSLRDLVEALPARTDDESLSDRVWRLAERVDDLADTSARNAVEASAFGDLRRAVDELANRQSPTEQLERLSDRVEELARSAAETAGALAARTADPPGVTHDTLSALEARLDELAQRLAELPAAAAGDASAAPLPAAITDRLAGTEHAVTGLTAELSRTAEIWYAGRAELEARLERLDARVAARATSGVASASGEGAPLPQVIEQEVERVLMAVERLGLHLSEHDRALAELMSRRGPSKVEELAARIDELEAYGFGQGSTVVAAASGDGTAAPVSLADTRDLRAELRSLARQVTELEDSSRTDREKFLTQLERMASSIDWRIRRIESGETTT